jgi:hypothetical protein
MINGNAVPVTKYFREEVSEITITAKNTRNLSRRSIRLNKRIQLHDPPPTRSIVHVGRSFNMYRGYNVILRAVMGFPGEHNMMVELMVQTKMKVRLRSIQIVPNSIGKHDSYVV